MMRKPDVSIITLNYNGFELTCAMIESVKRNVSLDYEIIVVDNASTLDEAGMFSERYPELKVVRSETNLGFAGGNNLGLKEATGRYLLFLNNDTELEDDSLSYLVERMDSDPSIGVVCPKIRFFYGERLIQFAGYTPLSKIRLRNSLIGFKCKDDGSFDQSCDSPYAHGAAMMVRRDVLDTAGLMYEKYFLYYEELDWSERIRKAGWRIVYEPRCCVFHKESATTGQDSPLRTYYITRNRLLFASRNLKGADLWLSLAYQILLVAPAKALGFLLKGRVKLAKAMIKGVVDFVTMDKE